MRYITASAAIAAATIFAQERPIAPPPPIELKAGALTIRPFGFFESIGMTRSSTTPDSVSTKFGKIPLTDTPYESLGTVRRSRLMLRSTLPVGKVKFTTYLESDFLNFTPGQSPFRWRQYFGHIQVGKWEVMGGQAWSLLRPNRVGTSPDRDTMNTDTIDPAYHVGLLGTRVRQVRVSRTMGIYKVATAWEGDGNFLTKIARDKKRQHLEAGAFTGRFGRRGIMAADVIHVTPRLRFVSQQYWSKRAAYQALGVVPNGVNGVSTIEGIEAQVKKSLEVYAYGGLVYGSRLDTAGNRVVSQWSVGMNHQFAKTDWRSGIMMSVQYSHLDRSVWDGRRGTMDYFMCRMRYTLNN